MLGFGYIKSWIYDSTFDGGAALADKTENLLDDELVEITREGFRPLLVDRSKLAACTRTVIKKSLQASVRYARAHKKCKWLWKWLKEVRTILNELELEK